MPLPILADKNNRRRISTIYPTDNYEFRSDKWKILDFYLDWKKKSFSMVGSKLVLKHNIFLIDVRL